MHGGHEEKLATLRAAFLFFMTFPGKKLAFMGTEYGMHREWDHDDTIEWGLLSDERYDALREYVASLNRLYLSSPELYELDFSEDGFSWLLPDEAERDLVSYLRRACDGSELVVAVSFSGAENRDVAVSVPSGRYRSFFSTHGDLPYSEIDTDREGRLMFSLPPFGGVVLKRINDAVTL